MQAVVVVVLAALEAALLVIVVIVVDQVEFVGSEASFALVVIEVVVVVASLASNITVEIHLVIFVEGEERNLTGDLSHYLTSSVGCSCIGTGSGIVVAAALYIVSGIDSVAEKSLFVVFADIDFDIDFAEHSASAVVGCIDTAVGTECSAVDSGCFGLELDSK